MYQWPRTAPPEASESGRRLHRTAMEEGDQHANEVNGPRVLYYCVNNPVVDKLVCTSTDTHKELLDFLVEIEKTGIGGAGSAHPLAGHRKRAPLTSIGTRSAGLLSSVGI